MLIALHMYCIIATLTARKSNYLSEFSCYAMKEHVHSVGSVKVVCLYYEKFCRVCEVFTLAILLYEFSYEICIVLASGVFITSLIRQQ